MSTNILSIKKSTNGIEISEQETYHSAVQCDDQNDECSDANGTFYGSYVIEYKDCPTDESHFSYRLRMNIRIDAKIMLNVRYYIYEDQDSIIEFESPLVYGFENDSILSMVNHLLELLKCKDDNLDEIYCIVDSLAKHNLKVYDLLYQLKQTEALPIVTNISGKR